MRDQETIKARVNFVHFDYFNIIIAELYRTLLNYQRLTYTLHHTNYSSLFLSTPLIHLLTKPSTASRDVTSRE